MEEKKPNTRLIVAVVIVVVVIVGVVVWAINGSNNGSYSSAPIANQTDQNQNVQGAPTPATSVAPKTMTVTYTDSGFSPSTIMINQGDTVTFVNQSSRRMDVASDPHPLHTDYPGFDEKEGSGPGASYSFTFDRIGQWSYHNHNMPRDKGTVNVSSLKG